MSNRPNKPASSGVSRVTAARAQGRSRTTTLLVVGVVLVLGVALIAAVALSSGSDDKPKVATATERKQVMATIAGLPAATFDEVGAGTISAPPAPAQGEAITKDGKPEVLYIGAEFCPYCAAERWSVAAALGRFGTFTNVGTTHSAAEDVHPNTATLTFHGSSYTSRYVAFTGIEAQSNQKAEGGGYAPLDPVSPAQDAIWTALSPSKSFPFLDIGGKYVISGASYDPQVLQGKTATEIADALADPSTDIAKGAIGAANAITAAICSITDNQPATVCNSKAVTELKSKLG